MLSDAKYCPGKNSEVFKLSVLTRQLLEGHGSESSAAARRAAAGGTRRRTVGAQFPSLSTITALILNTSKRQARLRKEID